MKIPKIFEYYSDMLENRRLGPNKKNRAQTLFGRYGEILQWRSQRLPKTQRREILIRSSDLLNAHKKNKYGRLQIINSQQFDYSKEKYSSTTDDDGNIEGIDDVEIVNVGVDGPPYALLAYSSRLVSKNKFLSKWCRRMLVWLFRYRSKPRSSKLKYAEIASSIVSLKNDVSKPVNHELPMQINRCVDSSTACRSTTVTIANKSQHRDLLTGFVEHHTNKNVPSWGHVASKRSLVSRTQSPATAFNCNVKMIRSRGLDSSSQELNVAQLAHIKDSPEMAHGISKISRSLSARKYQHVVRGNAASDFLDIFMSNYSDRAHYLALVAATRLIEIRSSKSTKKSLLTRLRPKMQKDCERHVDSNNFCDSANQFGCKCEYCLRRQSKWN